MTEAKNSTKGSYSREVAGDLRSYGTREATLISSNFGSPSSGVSMTQLWDYATKMSKPQHYQIREEQKRHYERMGPLEKTADSTVPTTLTPRDSYQRTINFLAHQAASLDKAYKPIEGAANYQPNFKYKTAA